MPVTRPSFHLPKLPSNLFGRAPSPVVGISMSDSAVTAALMDIHTGQYHLLDTAIVPCYDAFLHGKIIDKSALAAAITTAIQRLLIIPDFAITAVADDAIMRTRIELAGHLTDDEIEATILVDAERYIGQPLDDVYFDFCVDEYLTHSTAVWLTVAHRQAVDDCIEVLAMANLETQAVGVWSQSLVQAVQAFCAVDTLPIAIVEIQAHQTELLVVDDSGLRYRTAALFGAQTMDVGQVESSESPSILSKMGQTPLVDDGLDFYQFLDQYRASGTGDVLQIDNTVADISQAATDSMMDQSSHTSTPPSDYQIRFDDAPMVAQQPAESSDQVSPVSAPKLDAMCDQLSTMLQSYQTHHAPLPNRLLLSGIDTAVWAGLDEQLTHKLGVQVSYAVPSQRLSYAGFGTDAPKLLVAMALSASMQGINLLPWRDEKRLQDTQNFKKIFIIILSISALMLGLIYALSAYQTHKQAQINAIISARIDDNQVRLQQIHAIEQKIRDTKTKLSAIDLLEQGSPLISTWQTLPTLVPQGVYLDSIQQTADEITIAGMAIDSAQISAFASSLELSGLYAEVLVTALEDAKPAMRFRITAKKSMPSDRPTTSDMQMTDKDANQ